MHDGVEVAHQDEWQLYVAADVLQLAEEQTERHAVVQGPCGGLLDDDPVGHRVTEGDAYLNHMYAVALQGADDISGAIEGGTTGTEVDGKQITGIGAEELIDAVHNGYDFKL